MMFAMGVEQGLRERKKRETRQRISDVATLMFAARGFDDVTVAEVAAAANVSKMTVFNYFPRKEDLLFDRTDEALALLTGAIQERRPGDSFAGALRLLHLDLLQQRHPLSGLRDGSQHFWRIVLNSSTLRARARESVEELEGALAALLAEETAAAPGDPMPRLAATLMVAAWRVLYVQAARRLLTGERADDIWAEHLALAGLTFDMLDRAIGDYGSRPSGSSATDRRLA